MNKKDEIQEQNLENEAASAGQTEARAVNAEAQPDVAEQGAQNDESAEELADADIGLSSESADGEQSSVDEPKGENGGKKSKKAKKGKAEKKQKQSFGHKLRYGALSTGMVLVFLAVVIAVNAVVTLLLERYPISIDVTNDKIYEMSDTTINYIKDIDMDIEVTILMTKSEFESFLTSYGGSSYITQTEEMFKKFQQYNSKINIRFLSVEKNPDFIAEYSSDNLTTGNIVIQSDLRYKVTTVYDLYNIELDETTYYTTGETSYVVESSNVEDSMLSSLMFVTDEDPVRVAVIKGHGESDFNYLTDVLETNNYEISELKLISEDLTDKLDAVVIAAPTQDFTDAEIKKLDKYLNNDGKFDKNLIYLASAEQPELPKLESYLEEEWGVSIGDGYIMETDSDYTYGSGEYPLLAYVDEDYSSVISDTSNMLLLGSKVRPLTATYTETGNRSTSILFQTQETAVVKPSDAGDNWKTKNGTKASYAGGIMSVRTSVYNNEDVQSNVAVIGSIDIADALFYYSSTNQQYIVNMFDVMTERDSGITILSKTIGYNQMSLTTQQTNVMGVIFIGVIPIICIFIGFVVWLRRRHK